MSPWASKVTSGSTIARGSGGSMVPARLLAILLAAVLASAANADDREEARLLGQELGRLHDEQQWFRKGPADVRDPKRARQLGLRKARIRGQAETRWCVGSGADATCEESWDVFVEAAHGHSEGRYAQYVAGLAAEAPETAAADAAGEPAEARPWDRPAIGAAAIAALSLFVGWVVFAWARRRRRGHS